MMRLEMKYYKMNKVKIKCLMILKFYSLNMIIFQKDFKKFKKN